MNDAVTDIPSSGSYWYMLILPASNSTNTLLGYALHMVAYPNIEYNPECIDTPVIASNEPFLMLEMAHFDSIEVATTFIRDFKSYLIPGLLEGPELAEEVARLKDLPVEWKSSDKLTVYQKAQMVLIGDNS